MKANIMPEQDTTTEEDTATEENKCTYSCGYCTRDCPCYDPEEDDRYRLICDDFDLW